jgi:hypothetical protein
MDLKNPQSSERYAVDPTPEDVAFLETVPNLSPTCYDVPRGCLEMDLDKFRTLEPKPDFWLYVDNGATDEWEGFFTDYIANITEIMGKPPIFIDTLFEDGHGCREEGSVTYKYFTNKADTCFQRSLIDVHKRLEELSVFLGINLEGSDKFSAGQQEMCDAAAHFTQVAEDSHTRGVRVAEAWFEVLPDSVQVSPFAPYGNAFLRTLEELGMPVVHPGYCIGKPCNSGIYGPDYETINATGWFVNCKQGQEYSSCNDETLYNVDLWLVGGREVATLELGQDSFESLFPDKAVLAGQFTHIPLNDGTISYHNIARFLKDMADVLEAAQPLHSTANNLPCSDVDVTSNEHISAGNVLDFSTVQPRQTACFNEAFLQTSYFMCPSSAAGTFATQVFHVSSLVTIVVITTNLIQSLL